MSAATPRSSKDYRRPCNTTPKVLRDAMTTGHSTSDVRRELPVRTCATTARPDRITWLMAWTQGALIKAHSLCALNQTTWRS